MPFHKEKLSTVRKLLDYSRIDKEAYAVPNLSEPDFELESQNNEILCEV
jgi:hypothetical protein